MRLDVVPSGVWLPHVLYLYSESNYFPNQGLANVQNAAHDELRMILAAGLVSQEVVLNYSGNGYPDTIGLTPEIEVASDALRQIQHPDIHELFQQSLPRANEFGEHVSKLGRLNKAGVFGIGTPDGPGDDMESNYHYRPGKVDGFAGSESGLSNASIRTLQILGSPFSPPLIDSRSEGWYVSEMGQDFLARYSDDCWREGVPSLAHRSLRAAPIYIASAIPDIAALPTDDYLEWRAFLSPSIDALTSEIELRLRATRGLDPQDDIDFLTSETSPLDDLYIDLQREIEASTLLRKLTDALPGATFGTMVAGFQSLIAGVPLGTIPAVAIGSLSVFFIGLVTKLRQHMALRSHPMYWRTSLDSAAFDQADD